MLSRTQEARVLMVISHHLSGVMSMYCLDHLAIAARVYSGRGGIEKCKIYSVLLSE